MSAFPANAVVVEDNDASVVYAPKDAWTASTDPNAYTGGSYHLTYALNATATFTFSGEHFWFLTDENFDHGRFSISVDGATPLVMTSLKSEYTTTHPVFHTQLEAGRHVVVLKNLEDKKGLGVDQFVILPVDETVPSTTQTTTTTTTPASTPQLPNNPVNTRTTISTTGSIPSTPSSGTNVPEQNPQDAATRPGIGATAALAMVLWAFFKRF